MLDNLNARDGSGDAHRERPRRASEYAQPLSDKEVPIGGTATSEMINSWLDGDAPEPVAVNAESARQVDLWRRIEEESQRRRHLVTPAHVKAQIMAAFAYYQSNKYDEAIIALDRFISLHPGHRDIPYD